MADTKIGNFNKQTYQIKIYNSMDNSVASELLDTNTGATLSSIDFGGNVETAKNYFLTSDAINCIETNAQTVQWAITDDGYGLKYTITFGVAKDPNGTSWSTDFKTTQQTLINAGTWVKSSAYNPIYQNWKSESVDSHLF